VSQSGASLLLVLCLFGMALFLLVNPPPGFEEALLYRLSLPFVLVATAVGVLENLRTRSHMAQLIGAIRTQAGKRGVPPSPEVVREAVEILIHSLRSGEERVRETATRELRKLTGQEFGPDHEAWVLWWAANKERFGKQGP